MRGTSCLLACFFAPLAWAVEVPGAAPSPMVNGLQLVLSLGLVILLIVCLGWLLKKLNGGGFLSTPHLKLVSSLMLGNRERVVIVEVKDTWLILGVTGQAIQTLHTMAKPEDADAAQAASPDFALKLKQILQRGKPVVADDTPPDGSR